jgi:hypothetical protein
MENYQFSRAEYEAVKQSKHNLEKESYLHILILSIIADTKS